MTSIPRRHALGALATGALGAALAPAAAASARRDDPPTKGAGPFFKFSLAAYSYRSLLQGDPPRMGLPDFIDDCAAFGLEGAELTSYYFPKEVTPELLNDLKRRCFRAGLSISGTAVGNDFGWPEDRPERRQQIEHVKTWIRHAQAMGAPVIRVFAGHDKAGVSREDSHRLMVSALQEVCEDAGRHGVHLALENHGGPTATAEGLLRLVRDVDSPWFGVNLDTGNFHSADYYTELERAAPHALNVQVKVAVSGPDKVKHPTDYARLGKILKDAGYRGFVVLEYEEGGDPRAASREHLDRLRAALA